MSLRVHNFAGVIGWNARKYLPKIASNLYLKYQFATRGKSQDAYIKYFLEADEVPHPNVVNLETINKCNSTCEFCSANKNVDKRPYEYMSDELFKSIIDQLRDWNYKGHLTMYGNNEPWLDKNIVERHKYAREQLPECYIFMSTNGLILNANKVKSIIPYVDQLIINNYSLNMRLHDNLQVLHDYIKDNPKEFDSVDILFQMRYLKEVLTNRAGSAPNKQGDTKIITETCLMPFTDMWIVPNGTLGICCCDNFEVTKMADLNEVSLKEAWNSPEYKKLRNAIRGGRQNYPFCKRCDFIDAGLRMDIVNGILKDKSR